VPAHQDPRGLLLLRVRPAHFPAPTCNQLCQHGPADDRCHQVSGFRRVWFGPTWLCQSCRQCKCLHWTRHRVYDLFVFRSWPAFDFQTELLWPRPFDTVIVDFAASGKRKSLLQSQLTGP